MSNFQFQRFDLLLRTYEEAAERAAANGLDIVSQNYEENWDYLQAVFFSTTILTTIGTVYPGRYLMSNIHIPRHRHYHLLVELGTTSKIII